MISKGDDYPIHQLPTPVAEVGTERNFYDRYFFNGYSQDGNIFFAAAFCVYPNLNVKDASFVLVLNKTQHNFRYSDVLHQERLNTEVGNFKIEIIEPLKELRITLEDKEKEISVGISFTGRFEPMEEPRMTIKNGSRVFMDSTRMTQHGAWDGSIKFKQEEITVASEDFCGTRDRSWGIRPVGLPDAQIMPPMKLPQFYWLWAPANFLDQSSHLYFVDDENGNATNSHCVQQNKLQSLKLNKLDKRIEYKPNSRRITKAEFMAEKEDGTTVSWSLTPKYQMFMCGLGYMHPEWGHGMFHGENQSLYDSYDLNQDPHDPPFLHIQAICDFEMKDGDIEHKGIGVLEQLLVGPHFPSGFKGLLDGQVDV
ncbi:MAG: hypothetical protein P8J48_00655 [SAR86 cluster bacterium]|nr:hypothetical protein [SAR86 cluster bacterium]